MSDIVANIAKGRATELANRVKVGDPAASRLYVIPIDRAAVTDAQLRDADDFAAMVTLGVTERTANGWNRKTLAAADLAAFAPDDTNDRTAVAVVVETWTPTADTVTDLVFCYASVSTPTNAQLLPLTVAAFAISPDGSLVQLNAGDFYRAA